MARCLLAVGSNLGDRQAILGRTCADIAALPCCQLLARSRWHWTRPIGGTEGQDAFLNGALLIETTLQPAELALALQAIETRLGRERIIRWAARTLDIDLLLYSTAIIHTSDLVVPHPRMAFRLFVLEPATEVAGEMLHPTSGWTLSGLLGHLRNSRRYLVVTATEQPIADWLVSHLSQKLGCPVWPKPLEKIADASVLQQAGGVEFSSRLSGQPPVVVTMRPESLENLVGTEPTRIKLVRPALVIALDIADPQALRDAARDAITAAGSVVDPNRTESTRPGRLTASVPNSYGLGPMARIVSEDPGTVLQEALAAVRCVWPDLDCRASQADVE